MSMLSRTMWLLWYLSIFTTSRSLIAHRFPPVPNDENNFSWGKIVPEHETSSPQNVQVRLLSPSTVVVQWDEPETADGHEVQGYKVYYTADETLITYHWQFQNIGNNQLTTISELTPHTIYTIKVQVCTSVGVGPFSPPVQIKTQQGVPTQPSNLRMVDAGENWITLKWNKPSHSSESIVSYELYWKDIYTKEEHHQRIPVTENYTLSGLYPNTQYIVSLAARSQRGEGVPLKQLAVTQLYVPGDPQNVKATPINPTSIKVNWEPPQVEERNGIIMGYRVHIQESQEEGKTFLNSSMSFKVSGEDQLEFNVTDLEPDTLYSIQVAALTRLGDGDRSPPVHVRTPGGVPNRPTFSLKIIEGEPTVTVELDWSRSSETSGELKGYRLRYGVRDQQLKEVELEGLQTTPFRISDLERGLEYEFRVAGQNDIGIGQEAVQYLKTPEGPPTGPPTNITYHFQTADIVCFTWDPPTREQRNGQIKQYDIYFHKKADDSNVIIKNVSQTKAIFTDLEENTEYVFHVKAYTSQGAGPNSEKIDIQTERDIGRAPLSVKAVATSDSSVEVWWEPVPSRGKVIGYQIFYTLTAIEDLDKWQQKSVGLTESADLVNLQKNLEYTITVAAVLENVSAKSLGRISEKVTVKVKPVYVPLNLRAHDVTTQSMTLSWEPPIRLNPRMYELSFHAIKEFVDSQGITQTRNIPHFMIALNKDTKSHTFSQPTPFTTYSVNVSALPTDYSYCPPVKITVTTQMAAPPPMVKPDFYGVVNSEEIHVILPQASEEYGPISHYYLVVVPEDNNTVLLNPDQFLTAYLVNNKDKIPENPNLPYIAAKFPQRNIPYAFLLGTGEDNDGFTNYKLLPGKRYCIFVRAVVDTPQKDLYTNSPFSEFLSLDMQAVLPGDTPLRPNPNVPTDNDVKVSS